MEDDIVVCLINVEGGRTSPSTTQTLRCNNENEKSIVNMIVTDAVTVEEELMALISLIRYEY